MALEDLNGDGVLDLLLSEGGGSVSIGNGNGTFRVAAGIPTAGFTYDLAVEDLNGDGFLDVVSAGDGGIFICIGVGNGTFRLPALYQAEAFGSRAVALEDLNGDQILDMVTTGIGMSAGETTVRLGNGDGTFGSGTTYQAETGASYALALGDLNGDSVLDLITTGAQFGSPGEATVRLGRGDGTFGGATSYVAGSSGSLALSIGDLNGDGFLDLELLKIHLPRQA